MLDHFDRRIVAPELLASLQSCQKSVPFHLAGGAALAGVHLRHRLSRDADLFYHEREAHRIAVRLLPELAKDAGLAASIVRDAGTFVRAVVDLRSQRVELDLVFEAVPDIGAHPDTIEGILVESFDDLRVNKLTCILSRSEPRDLVDLRMRQVSVPEGR
jgi:hypothetical protein